MLLLGIGPASQAEEGGLAFTTETFVENGAEGSALGDSTVAVTGGTEPYAYSLAPSSNPLPAGVTINATTGKPQGTPTESGTFSGLKVRVTDDAAATADTSAFAIAITPAIPTLTALSAYSLDYTTNTVLFAKDATTARHIVSITKYATAILFARYVAAHSTWASTITVITADISGGSGPGFQDGDVLTNEDALYALVTGSSNTMAKTIGRVVGATLGGTENEAQFVVAMNALATEFSWTSATFTSPDGLAAANVMSARDVAYMSRDAIDEDALIETAASVGQYTLTITGPNARSLGTSTSNDRLMNGFWMVDKSMPVPFYEGVGASKLGGATGVSCGTEVYTTTTGHRVVNVIWTEGSGRFEDTITIARYVERDWEWVAGTPIPKTADTFAYSNAEAKALIRTWGTAPGSTHKGLVDDFFTAIKADVGLDDPIIDSLDFFFCDLAHTSQATRQNWVNPLGFSERLMTTANTAIPAFTAFACHQPVSGREHQRRLHFNPTTFVGAKYSLNSGCHGGHVLTARAANAGVIGFRSSARLIPFTTGNVAGMRVNTTASTGITHDGVSNGFYIANRPDSTKVDYYKNGSIFGTDTRASSAVANESWLEWADAFNTGFSTDRIACVLGGSHLTADQIAALDTAWDDLRTGLLALA